MEELRIRLMNLIDEVLPCFYMANDDPVKTYQLSKTNHNFVVLIFDHVEPSARNGLASFRVWRVCVFVEGGSLLPIDEYVSQLEKKFEAASIENMRGNTGDYFDTLLGKYRNEIQLRTPRGAI